VKKFFKKLATKKIILLALSATGIGAYFSPQAMELAVIIMQTLAEVE